MKLHERDEHIRMLQRYINDTPELLSLLYDIDMMPEQLKIGTREFCRMLAIAEAWRHSNTPK